MVKTFFKDNAFFLAMLAIMAILLLFVIPYLEKSYLDDDITLIRKKTIRVLLWVVLILFGIFIVIWLKVKKGFKAIFKSVVSTIVVLASFSFALHPFILTGLLFLNKLYTRETVQKKCTVVYSNEDFLRVKDDNITFDIKTEKLIPAKLIKLMPNSAVTVIQKKGLLGFYFAPTVVQAQN